MLCFKCSPKAYEIYEVCIQLFRTIAIMNINTISIYVSRLLQISNFFNVTQRGNWNLIFMTNIGMFSQF